MSLWPQQQPIAAVLSLKLVFRRRMQASHLATLVRMP
eukprot:COSAG02_NODE_57201_length_281_cov_1.137363_1_plen_36_part_01